MISQSQFREEQEDRRQVVLSDRPQFKKSAKHPSRAKNNEYDARSEARAFSSPFKLQKNGSVAESSSAYLRNVEHVRDEQLKKK